MFTSLQFLGIMYSLAAWITGTWAGFTVSAKKGGLGGEIYSFGQVRWFCLFSSAYRVKRHNYKYITIILNSYIRHMPWKWPEWMGGLNLDSAGILLPVHMITKLQTAGLLQIKWEHWTLTSQRTYRQNHRLLLIVPVHVHNPTIYWHSHARSGTKGLKTATWLIDYEIKNCQFLN